MEKVKLTKSQAEEIERIKKVGYPVMWKDDGWYIARGDKIEDLSFYQYITAINEGYEVDPDIKVGDFVDIGLFGINKVAEVTGIKGDAIAINGSDEYNEFKINRILTDEEKQEEKERRFFAKNDRKPWELKRYDNLGRNDGSTSYTVWDVSDDGVRFNEFGMFFKWNEIKKGFKVSCFAHDRKDI